MGSLEDWYEYGHVSELKRRFRLILTDARGHGKSGKPHDPDQYSPELDAGDIVTVLDEIKVARCHYLGFSLGGRIGYWMARFHPERLLSLMVIGSPPYAWNPARIKQMVETIDVWAPESPKLSENHKSRLLENDKRALVARASILGADESDILHSLSIPHLIMSGDRDGGFEDAKRSASEAEGATFVQLAGFDHLDSLVRSDVTIPHIIDFLSSLGVG
jgi:pimeloyl-ACP methyl ester carboxylesterase